MPAEKKKADAKKTKAAEKKVKKEKNLSEEELIADESFDENDEESILIEKFKEIEKIVAKKSKKVDGSKELSQDDIFDASKKYDFTDDDSEKLLNYLQEHGYSVLSDEEEELDDMDFDESDMLKAEKEAEEEELEDVDDDDVDKEEISGIDDFSKIQSGEVKVNDSVKMYLKEIGKVDLLTAKQETELAQRIVKGEEASKELQKRYEKYCSEVDEAIKAFEANPPSEETAAPTKLEYKDWFKQITFRNPDKELFSLKVIANDGRQAKDNLITANLRLVIAIAKHYVGRGMHFLDLIQEGNMGLIKAVEKFDYTKGFKFSTYATWWIRQAITRAIADQARTIRIPVHMVETINKMTRVQRQLVQEYGRDPTPEEISAALDGSLTPERIREIQRIALEPVSLETPIGEEDDSHLGDFIEDKETQSPEEFTTRSLLKEELYSIMCDLTDRECEVLKLRYGLEDGHPRTLEEVGKVFGVTRERIRQIEAKAIRKLRHPTRAKRLGDYKEVMVFNGPDTHSK